MKDRDGESIMPKKRQEKLSQKQSGKPNIERLYEELFVTLRSVEEQDAKSLEQPTIYKVVETVTTYGAYEDPL